MKKFIGIIIVSVTFTFFYGCEHLKKHFASFNDEKIMLKTDTLNVITMKDTMVIMKVFAGAALTNIQPILI